MDMKDIGRERYKVPSSDDTEELYFILEHD